MNGEIRGIECSLYSGQFEEFLMYLSYQAYEFYIVSCMKIGTKRQFMPELQQNISVTRQTIQELAKTSIWELVLHLYPTGKLPQTINTYQDFINSGCDCCLIFYDCGLLNIYIKDKNNFECFWKKLCMLKAQEIRIITDDNDNRTVLHL